ncbi:hypothetical protein DVH05_002648 [Phytophthora capsici]|nr:hypothetical protein DVH05_002648 [Phytophthora capsici]
MAEATPAQPQAAANTKFYMKNAVFSMVLLYLAHQFAGYISDRDVHINDHSWFGEKRYESLRLFDPKSTHNETQYVAMCDGADLAVDSYLADYFGRSSRRCLLCSSPLATAVATHSTSPLTSSRAMNASSPTPALIPMCRDSSGTDTFGLRWMFSGYLRLRQTKCY